MAKTNASTPASPSIKKEPISDVRQYRRVDEQLASRACLLNRCVLKRHCGGSTHTLRHFVLSGMKTKDAVDHLVKQLNKDKGYRESWKANIAMAFLDSWFHYSRKHPKKTMSKSDRHAIANNAADLFLELLCMKRPTREYYAELNGCTKI